jgi:hypothetical protein
MGVIDPILICSPFAHNAENLKKHKGFAFIPALA